MFIGSIVMKIAVIGSRNLTVKDLGQYLPKEVTEIVSGGARGIDTSAREYALANGIKLTEFLPQYDKHSRCAPLKRNLQIIDYADNVDYFVHLPDVQSPGQLGTTT